MWFVKRFTRLLSQVRDSSKPVSPGLFVPLGPAAGGKAAGLLRLAEARLPIPETRCIPSAAFWQHLESMGVAERVRAGDSPADLADQIRSSTIRPDWVEGWRVGGAKLGNCWVVRSSGVEEDGRERSFAGVHHTAIGVAPADLEQAVLEVWASAFSDAARAYGVGGGMAIVLQPLLHPLAAGVVFTVNPQTGSWREMVVESVRGQGDALVSGRQAPQWTVVRRSRHRKARSMGLRILDEDVVPQPITWTSTDGELQPVATPPDAVNARLLRRDATLRLCRLCLRAERAFGEPVDVEFAWDGRRFVLLQARPITRVAPPRPRDVLWTRRFLGERWPRPPTPMTWSVLAPLLEHFIGYPSVNEQYLGGGPALRQVGAHAYLNVTVFRHLLFKWPGAPAPSFMLELLPPHEVDHFQRAYRVRPDWAVYIAIFKTTLVERRWQRFAFNPRTNPLVWEDFVEHLHASLLALEQERDPRAAVGQYRDLLRQYLSIHVCSLLFANLSYQLLQAAVMAWLPGPPAVWMADLATSEGGNRTLELNEALQELAEQLGAAGRERLADGEVAPETAEFLARYGARAEASWEIFSPRWRDEPARLLAVLDGARRAVLPRETAHGQTNFPPLSPTRRAVLDSLVFFTQRYLLLRENQRFEFDALMAGLQARLVALGREQGVSDEDVRWCTVDELLAGGVDPSTLGERRASWQSAPRRPPVFLTGDLPAEAGQEAHCLRGQGISAGRVRGRVRLLHTLADGASLQHGEILVAPAVDPGWTPLLTRAAGLVLELGSLLGHGSVIAREYQVPGVVNVSGVTERLQTGMEVTVDGSRGLVWVHDPLR